MYDFFVCEEFCTPNIFFQIFIYLFFPHLFLLVGG